jgi:hypothetical protein
MVVSYDENQIGCQVKFMGFLHTTQLKWDFTRNDATPIYGGIFMQREMKDIYDISWHRGHGFQTNDTSK